MKAFYDSEADALQIHLTEPPRIGYSEDVDGAACFVEVDDNEEKVGLELLDATEHLGLIDIAAERFELDAADLHAVAAAAMAAPLRYVTVEAALAA